MWIEYILQQTYDHRQSDATLMSNITDGLVLY
jgi:hypothetical protein